MANGDTTKAIDLYVGRNETKTINKGVTTNKTTNKNVTTSVISESNKELVTYQTTLNNLQEQHNQKLITELEYKKKVKETEENHLKQLFQTNKVTQEDIDRYNKADLEYQQANIKINYESNINDIKKQYEDGFITAQQKAEGIADALKNVYVENLKIGSATKEMADNYNKAKQNAENLAKASDIKVKYQSIETEYKPQQSSYEKAVNIQKSPMEVMEDKMNHNDQIILELSEILTLYKEIGLEGSDAYNEVYESLQNVIGEQSKLSDEAQVTSSRRKKIEDNAQAWGYYSEMIQGAANGLQILGNS